MMSQMSSSLSNLLKDGITVIPLLTTANQMSSVLCDRAAIRSAGFPYDPRLSVVAQKL